MKTKRLFAAILSAALLLSFFAIGPGIIASAAGRYTITYNANGGNGAPEAHESVDKTTTLLPGFPLTTSTMVVSNVAPTRAGYNFKGWADTSSATEVQYQPGSSYSISSNKTIYAVWASIPGVFYDANGGTGAPGPHSKPLNTTLSKVVPTREGGYTFMGWATTPTAATAQYQPGGTYTFNILINHVYLYAVWKLTYAVTYDANGGIGAPPAQAKFHNEPLTLSMGTQATPPHRLGYVFKGWATDAGATEAEYQTGEPYWDNAPMTLYAVWESAYFVTYDANGGGGAPAAQTKHQDVPLTLSLSTPYRVGYNFVGWATSPSGAPQYQPGQVIPAPDNASQTLYAVWVPNANPGPDLRQGVRIPAGIYPQNKVTDPALIARLNAAPPSDLEWYAAKLGDIELDGVRYATENGEWFRFEPIVWRVLESDQNTVTLLADRIMNAHAAATFTVNIAGQLVEEDGLFELFDWMEEETTLRIFSPGYNYQDYIVPMAIDIPLTFLGITFNLGNFVKMWVWGTTLSTIDLNNGRWGFGTPQSRVAAPTDYAVAKNIYANGNGARWWALHCTLLSTNVVTGTFGLGKCVDYNGNVVDPVDGYLDSRMGLRPLIKLTRAFFNPPPITFHANGGADEPVQQPVIYGEPLVLTNDEPTRANYTFIGWSEDPQAQVADYLPGHTWFEYPDRLRGYEYTSERPLDLYAVWELMSYPVIYKANGGTGAPPAQKKIYGVPLNPSPIVPTREGYNFKGWGAYHAATKPISWPYTDNKALTLYAIWQPVAYELKFYPRTTTDPNFYIEDETYHDRKFYLNDLRGGFPGTFKRENEDLLLLGWSEDPAATQADYPPDGVLDKINRSAEFYAVWVFNGDPEDSSSEISNVYISPASAFPPGTVMYVDSPGPTQMKLPDSTVRIFRYDIKFTIGEPGDPGYQEDVQPNGYVTVRLAVPKSCPYDPYQLIVLHGGETFVPDVLFEDDGTVYLLFQTNHFSAYDIVWVPKTSGGGNNQGNDRIPGGDQSPEDDNQTADSNNQTPDVDDQTPGIDNQTPGGNDQTPVAALKWWQKLPCWIQLILRYVLFGWIWMN